MSGSSGDRRRSYREKNQPRIDTSDFLIWLLLENKAVENRSKNDLTGCILDLAADAGYQIRHLDSDLEESARKSSTKKGKNVSDRTPAQLEIVRAETIEKMLKIPSIDCDALNAMVEDDPEKPLAQRRYDFESFYDFKKNRIEVTRYHFETYFENKKLERAYTFLKTNKTERAIAALRYRDTFDENFTAALENAHDDAILARIDAYDAERGTSVRAIYDTFLSRVTGAAIMTGADKKNALICCTMLRNMQAKSDAEETERSKTRDGRVRNALKDIRTDSDPWDLHFFLHTLLWSLGFHSIYDSRSLNIDDMYEGFDRRREDIITTMKNLSHHAKELLDINDKIKGISTCTKKNSSFLHSVNATLCHFYGIRVVRPNRHKKLYRLTWPIDFNSEVQPVSVCAKIDKNKNFVK